MSTGHRYIKKIKVTDKAKNQVTEIFPKDFFKGNIFSDIFPELCPDSDTLQKPEEYLILYGEIDHEIKEVPPFVLTDKQKGQLETILPSLIIPIESFFLKLEKICNEYNIELAEFNKLPTRAELYGAFDGGNKEEESRRIRLLHKINVSKKMKEQLLTTFSKLKTEDFNSYDNFFICSALYEKPTNKKFYRNTGRIGKIQNCIDANLTLMRAFESATPWDTLVIPRNLQLSENLKKINRELKQEIGKMELLRDRSSHKSGTHKPKSDFVDRLAGLYFEATGQENRRNNNADSGQQEVSPLADIIKILDETLGCGRCTWYIKNNVSDRIVLFPC